MAQNYETTTTTQDVPNPHAEAWQVLTESERVANVEERAREMAIQEVGSQLHDVWRAPRLQEDGTYDPREKTTTDEMWIEEHSTNIVDIANTDFQDLPQDWKQENEDAARVLIKLIRQHGSHWNVKNEQGEYTKEARAMASEVHDEWLGRENNVWAKGGELDVPFDKLPIDEQLKDLAQVELVMKLALEDCAEAYSAAGDGGEVLYNKFGVELGFMPYDEEDF